MLKSEQEAAIAQINNWISQFNKFDQPSAQNMINDLLVVNYSEFKTRISEIIYTIAHDYNKIALFSVNELSEENVDLTNNPSRFDSRIALRRLSGSSSQVDYILSCIAEQNPKKLIARPRSQSMISEQIGAIIYVDDFIGSGERIITFWQNYISKKIKSWLSYNKCDIYFISYAYMDAGINNILKKCRGIQRDEFRAFKHNPTFINTHEVKKLCDRYVNWEKGNKYGYGNLLTNIVFEWKCPNNTPPLLWMDNRNWKPLLRKRNVDYNIFRYFDRNHNIRIIETLWNAAQYNIALSIADNINNLSYDNINFICFLSLIAKRTSMSKIQQILNINDREMMSIIAKAKNIHAIQYNKISDFGKELLEYYRCLSHKAKKPLPLDIQEEPYIPSQYGGYSCI